MSGDFGNGGKKIIAGNERVISSRLFDALFFWQNDLHISLKEKLKAVNTTVFHRLLGFQGQKIERIKNLTSIAAHLLNLTEKDTAESLTIAELIKADLSSQMVIEFPELQGIMGKYYALREGYSTTIAQGIQDHYKPKGPTDTLPVTLVASLVALVDKIDTLVGFWILNEVPTSTKDPFALRRAALGVIRILYSDLMSAQMVEFLISLFDQASRNYQNQGVSFISQNWRLELLKFLEERSKIYLKDQGYSPDMIQAVYSQVRQQTTFGSMLQRIQFLRKYSENNKEDFLAFLVLCRRFHSILEQQEKKENKSYMPLEIFYTETESFSIELLEHIQKIQCLSLENENHFLVYFDSWKKIIPQLNTFFETIRIDVQDVSLKTERLQFLALMREVSHNFAYFSLIEAN